MWGKKVKLRAFFIILVFVSIVLTAYIILKALEDNVVYFLTPTEIHLKDKIDKEKKVRVGGMVKKNSIKSNTQYINFIITDYKNEINVTYAGSIPNLFEEGRGVVAEGKLKDKNYFIANRILAKHDENYMPPKIQNLLTEK